MSHFSKYRDIVSHKHLRKLDISLIQFLVQLCKITEDTLNALHVQSRKLKCAAIDILMTKLTMSMKAVGDRLTFAFNILIVTLWLSFIVCTAYCSAIL